MISEKQKAKNTRKRNAGRSPRFVHRDPTGTLAFVAHELRSPLASIQFGLNILEISPIGPEATQARELMQRQLDHASHLVNDLLDLSRVRANRLTISKSENLIQDIINLSLESSRAGIKNRHHTLKVVLPDEPIILNCDRRRLAQVVINLIDNAAKFTPEAGTISLTVATVTSEVVITVTDNGVGIADGDIDSIFRPFAQVDEARPRTGEGLGLGLFLVKAIVEAHGGSIEVKSAGAHCGASFRITIPQ